MGARLRRMASVRVFRILQLRAPKKGEVGICLYLSTYSFTAKAIAQLIDRSDKGHAMDESEKMEGGASL